MTNNNKSKSKLLKIIAYAFMITFILPSCSVMKSTPDPVKLLTSGTWELRNILGLPINPLDFAQGLPNLSFGEDGRISGFGGCNTLSGAYKLAENGLTFDGLAATRKTCQGVREDTYLDMLERTTGFDIKDGNLRLLEEGRELISFVKK